MTRSAPSFIKRLTAGILVLNLSVVALAALSLSRSRQEYTERAGVTARNLSHVLEQYVIGVIGKVDVGLLAVTAEAQQQIARGGIDGQRLCAYMEREQTYLPELDSLRAIDSRGAFICRNGMTGKAVTAADRDFFIRLHDAPGSGVAISKPFKGRISGKWVIVVARRINRPDGSFAGVIAAAIALERINTIFAATDVGRHGSIVLLDGGGGGWSSAIRNAGLPGAPRGERRYHGNCRR